MTVDPFSVPSGGGAGLDDLVGRVLVFHDITIRENCPNPFNPGQTRDEADAAIVDLDGGGNRDKGGVFGTRLVRQLKARAPYGFAYGRLASVTVNGKSALELVDPGPAATAQVRAWVVENLPHLVPGAAPAAGPQATPSASPGAATAPGSAWHPGVAAPPAAAPTAPPAAPPF